MMNKQSPGEIRTLTQQLTQPQWEVAVVGAGLAGLAAASQFQAAGRRVVVVDKSRGLGGRLATRRAADQRLDHGCPYLQPTTPALATTIDQGQQAGILRPWQPAVYWAMAPATLRPGLPSTAPAVAYRSGPYYCAPGGMTALAKALAVDLPRRQSCRVVGLAPAPGGWQLQCADDTPAESAAPLLAKAVLLALPAPQILPLLAPLVPQVPALAEVVARLETVQFDPIITALAGYGDGQACWPPGIAPSPQGWLVQAEAPLPFRWAGLDSSKRPQPVPPAVVVHSSAAFAAQYLYAPDRQAVGRRLLAQSAPVLGPWLTQPQWLQVQGWRYGLVRQGVADPFLAIAEHGLGPAPLLCGGDWCQGTGTMGTTGTALAAGQAMATHLQQVWS